MEQRPALRLQPLFHQARQIGFRKLTILLMGNGADQAVVAAVRNGKQIA